MMDAMEVDVQARWRAREAPDGELIVFGDGTLSVMEFQEFAAPARWEWREILRARLWSPAHWLDVDLTLASSTGNGRRALAGESAAHGSIGWVALARADDHDALEWLAISQYANPFAAVDLGDSAVTATSTAGFIWRFPLDAPHQVTITADPRYPRPQRR